MIWYNAFRRLTTIITLALRGVTLPFLPGLCPESIERFGSDVQSSNPFRIGLVAAFGVSEPSLNLAVVAGNVPALRTGLGSFLGVNIDKGHTSKSGFVSDERCQPPEVPAGHHPVEFLGILGSLTNTEKVFECDGFTFALPATLPSPAG